MKLSVETTTELTVIVSSTSPWTATTTAKQVFQQAEKEAIERMLQIIDQHTHIQLLIKPVVVKVEVRKGD